jgi:hypothetical protein
MNRSDQTQELARIECCHRLDEDEHIRRAAIKLAIRLKLRFSHCQLRC